MHVAVIVVVKEKSNSMKTQRIFRLVRIEKRSTSQKQKSPRKNKRLIHKQESKSIFIEEDQKNSLRCNSLFLTEKLVENQVLVSSSPQQGRPRKIQLSRTTGKQKVTKK